MFSQVAAEVLGCEPTDIVVISSDTDLTPFDYGAYASSTTYISGQAVKEAAEDARERLVHLGSKMLDEPVENLKTGDEQGVQRGDRRRRVAGRNRVRSDVRQRRPRTHPREGQSLDGRKSAAITAPSSST